jgi:15-cis-phytoene synthase
MMAAIYRTLLREISTEPEKVLNNKTSIPPFRKLILALKTYFKYA